MATNNSSNAAAPAVRKRQQFRDTRNGVLPNSIEALSRLTLDAGMKTALTTAGAKLTIEIDAAGTRVFLADHRNGQLIGGPEDLSKLGSIRAFVTRERKETAGVEIAKEVSQIAFKAAVRLESEDPDYEQRSLDNSYGAAVRPLLNILDRLVENKKKITENTNPVNADVFKPLLEGYMNRMQCVYAKLILAITKGENTKGFLEEALLKEVVPSWVHTKLTVPNLVLDRNQELVRVLFPSDPSKGLSLTLKEWRHGVLRSNLGHEILGCSQIPLSLVCNDKLLRVLAKLDSSVDLSDETNPSVAKLLKSRVAVVPPMMNSRYVTEPGSKTKGGWKFPSPSMDSISGAIAALSTAILRVYSANLQSVDLVGDYYATIVPGSVKREALSATNNFYVQWSKAPDPNKGLFDRLSMMGDGKARSDLWRWLRTEMRLSEKAEGGKTLATALNLNEDGSYDSLKEETVVIEVPGPDKTEDGKPILVKESLVRYKLPPMLTVQRSAYVGSLPRGIRNIQRELSPVEVSQAKEFAGKYFPSKKGKKKVVGSANNLSKLTAEGQELIEEVKALSPHLSERIKVWLRSFSDPRLQRAAVKLTNASFDELFLQDDSEGNSSSSDDEDDAGED